MPTARLTFRMGVLHMRSERRAVSSWPRRASAALLLVAVAGCSAGASESESSEDLVTGADGSAQNAAALLQEIVESARDGEIASTEHKGLDRVSSEIATIQGSS